jgi:hypothetical protein
LIASLQVAASQLHLPETGPYLRRRIVVLYFPPMAKNETTLADLATLISKGFASADIKFTAFFQYITCTQRAATYRDRQPHCQLTHRQRPAPMISASADDTDSKYVEPTVREVEEM